MNNFLEYFEKHCCEKCRYNYYFNCYPDDDEKIKERVKNIICYGYDCWDEDTWSLRNNE